MQLLHDLRQLAAAVRREEGGELDIVVLATKLTSVGYRVHLRSALGGGQGVDAFHALRNEFIVVAGTGHDDGIDYIVESKFRSHFAIPHPTDRYAAVIAAVPDEIAAPAEALAPLVQLLCSELSLAFEQMGLSLPPWRQSKSLLSKWLPAKSRDLELSTSPAGSPQAVSPQGGSPLHMPRALSTMTSGTITPSASDELSPRAVVPNSAVPVPFVGQPRGLANIKPRSLLSANLAAVGTPKKAPTKPDGGVQNAAPGPSTEASEPTAWVTPPIRRVRMKGQLH